MGIPANITHRALVSEVPRYLMFLAPILLAIVGVAEVVSFRATLRALDRCDRAIATANEAERLLVDMETGVRGFVVTRDREFLAPRDAALEAIGGRYEQLEALVADDGRQLERLARIRAEDAEWRIHAEHLVTLRAADESAAARVAARVGKKLMDRVRRDFSELTTALADERARRSSEARVQGALAVGLVAGLLVFGMLAQGFVAQALTEMRGRAHLAAQRAALLREVQVQRDWLDAVLKQLPAGVAVAEPKEGRVVLRNASLAAATRVLPRATPEYECLGWKNAAGATLRADEYPLSRALRGDRVDTEVLAPGDRDGEDTVLHVVAAPLLGPSGEVTAAIATFVDVTDRKRAQDLLRASEARERAARREAERTTALLDAFLAASPVGFAFVGPDLRYVRVNDALAGINRVPASEHLGRTPRDVLPEPLASMLEPLVRRVLETGEPLPTFEASGTTAGSSEERWWLSTYYPVRSAEGSLLGVGAVVQEITERKRAEEERERLLALEKAARLEAERATRLRDEFLAIVSHDLRSPLSAILITAGLLLGGEGDGEAAAQGVRRIRSAARRMDAIINDLLDVARFEQGGLDLRLESATVDELLRETLEIHGVLAESASLRLEADSQAAGAVLRCDRGRILQVFSNLVGNAIKFTPPGGSIVVRAARDGGSLRFAVADTGPGMTEEQARRAFDRFWKGEGPRSGLGLGLYIAKEIVEAHGGRIWIESVPGAGTTFHFTLPLAQRD